MPDLRPVTSNADSADYLLRLYVAGPTHQSARAIVDAQTICGEYLQGRHRLEVVDIYQRPMLAEAEQIFAVPALVRYRPLPLRRMVGDLSDRDRVLDGLGLKTPRQTGSR